MLNPVPPDDAKRLRRVRVRCVMFAVLYVGHGPLAWYLGGQRGTLADADFGAMATITGLVTTVVLTLLWCFGLSRVIRTSLLAVMAFLTLAAWAPLVLYVTGRHTGSAALLAYQAVLALASVVATASVLDAWRRWPKPRPGEPPLL